MKLYIGIDLHSNNNYIAIQDAEGKAVYKKRLPNDLEAILEVFKPYKKDIQGIVVESTYNWYWLVDGLMAAGYKLHLANTTAIQQYSGLKYTDDKSDALWLAQLLRLNLLPEGHICPKEERSLRDLLRKRLFLVQQQTATLLSMQSTITRHVNIKLNSREIKKLTEEEIKNYLENENTSFSIISQNNVLKSLIKEITNIEKNILLKLKSRNNFQKLKSVPGIGSILGMTILLETGDMNRFKSSGNYASYCRCVSSKKISNGKQKGKNNKKNGNKYLAWAFIEAANFAIRYNSDIKKYYQRKMSKTNVMVAVKTIASKLSKAVFYIMRDDVNFDVKKLVN